jgi:hypothetical protein
VLDDHEQELLFEIERRLLIEDPDLVRSFGAVLALRPRDHHRDSVLITKIVGLALCVVLLIGPRSLTDAEIAIRGSTPRRGSRR